MRELPVDAKAVCRDGDAGQVTDVIVDPVARRVTHVVIREDRLGSREFLVPLELVIDSSRASVRLSCTRAELSQLPEFTTTRFVSASSPEAQPVLAAREIEMWTTTYGYEPIYLPYVPAADEQVPIVEARVPQGQLAFERGAHVQSSDDQYVGDVSAFVIRPEDAAISHFVVQLSTSAAHHGEVTLPVSTVKSADGALVRLTLSRAQVEQLPSVPAGSKFRPADDQAGSHRLVSIIFDRPEVAEDALRMVRSEARLGTVGRIEAAVIRKDADGKLTAREDNDLSTGRGAVAGAVAGGLLSLAAGPIGLVGAAAVGAAAGGLTARVIDRGVPDRYVRDLGRALRTNNSAIVLLVDEHHEAALLETLAPLRGQVLRLALTDQMLEQLIGSADQ